jgi:hypothetical protein
MDTSKIYPRCINDTDTDDITLCAAIKPTYISDFRGIMEAADHIITYLKGLKKTTITSRGCRPVNMSGALLQ